ncbi:hypothetical protein DICPUDRAFT_159459 [Dictyostelium purpureum]|uniref:Uncharacterized protein n=1 Tax=Dictyostelium purpureum TaxID=5786 RepID=F1A466_DICPU|nr:uncharacterized protein DICPUDRAFT_159459 [Dictyostelium purpureum]EGC29015.1 hypothetical protein DICPUDRAFT_159459 [Dictyostelium purpureum]|eukprot:XP_003294457.1 hypothetical protein DICPUDRAFT_159459 [Dictyostelium purpureum]
MTNNDRMFRINFLKPSNVTHKRHHLKDSTIESCNLLKEWNRQIQDVIHPTFPTAAATTINQFYFNRIKFKHKIIGLYGQKKIWSLLEIKLKRYKAFLETFSDKRKKEQLHMFDLVECAYSLDNIEALEYFLSMNVPTFLPNYTNNKKSFSISSIKSLELLLKYLVNIIEPYSIYYNNTTTTAPESTTFILKNSTFY